MANSASAGIDDFTFKFIGGSEQAVRITTIKTWTAIIKSSPVKEGRFRGNWFATGKIPSTKSTGKVDPSGSSTEREAQNLVLNLKDWSTFTLTNNLPYANVIEFGGYREGPNVTSGYSKQAPSGVVRVNMSRMNNLLEAEAKKYLPK